MTDTADRTEHGPGSNGEAVDGSARTESFAELVDSLRATFRTGRTEDNGGKPPANYGCGEGGTDTECAAFECGGVLSIAGMPYFVGTTNVN